MKGTPRYEGTQNADRALRSHRFAGRVHADIGNACCDEYGDPQGAVLATRASGCRHQARHLRLVPARYAGRDEIQPDRAILKPRRRRQRPKSMGTEKCAHRRGRRSAVHGNWRPSRRKAREIQPALGDRHD